MDHFVGLDVSVKETSVCIVDDTGKIVREVKVASEPDALLPILTSDAYRFKRIGLEAGPLSQWLFSALAEAGLPVSPPVFDRAMSGGNRLGAIILIKL
jgi:transposase